MLTSCSLRRTLLLPLTVGWLSGCAGMTDQQATVSQGTGLGALIGAGIGLATTGRPSGALLGAAAGAMVGTAVGHSVAERKAQYVREEDFLVAEIQRNDQFIREVRVQNEQLRDEIARLDRESEALAEAYQLGSTSRSALIQHQKKLERQLAKARHIQSLTAQQLADATRVYREIRSQRGAQDRDVRRIEQNVHDLQEAHALSQQNVADLEQAHQHMTLS